MECTDKVNAKTQNDKSVNSISQSRKNASCRSANSPVEKIMFLQKTAGNQAVRRLIKSRALQAKLRIGQPDDIYEQEADRVAEQVMRMPDPVLQRKCAKCNEDKERLLQTKKLPGQTPVTQNQDVQSIVSDVLNSPGQSLDSITRAFMELRFGQDFSRVRVHSGTAAERSAREVNANAYTAGHDIVFGAERFSPGTTEGRRLIAHELTHIVQQKGSTPLIQRKPDQDDDLNMRRRDEIALSRRSPGKFEIGTGFPPVMTLFNFVINDYQLKKEHKDNLKILGKLFGLMDTARWQVFVIGHADSTGEPVINDPLSANRANEVSKYLNSVAKGNYFIQGEGANRPAATNESISGRSRNRRVDITFSNPYIDIDIPDPIPDPKTVCQQFPFLCNEDKFCNLYPFLCGDGFCKEHPKWCGLPVLCLLFPPVCACLAKPIACACGRYPALCVCLANPKACIPKLPKPDDDKPKRKRACPTRVDLPSGVIEANKSEKIGFARLWYPFEMNIDFSQDSSGCECACGEYTQLVRGFFERDKTGKGSWKRDKHELTTGVYLHETIYQEDGLRGVGAYGHRYWDDDTRKQPKPDTKDDTFLLTRETGCQYRGKDEPSMESDRKYRARIRMYLEFAGGPIDVCESPGQRLGQQTHWRTWIIHGEAQAKSPPPGPVTPPTNSPSTTSPEVTEAKETDIPQGKQSPSWYAGGIPSDATSGTREYRMAVGFKVDGVTKFSLVTVRIEASEPDFITIITTNKRNLNLNPDDPKNPIIVMPDHRERIKRSILLKVENELKSWISP